MSETHNFETFRPLGSGEMINMIQETPSCLFRKVNVVKFKITIEPIEEPVEVIHDRIQKLWNECENDENRAPLKRAALFHGYTIKER